MKMHDQNDALSDTPKALQSLFLISLTTVVVSIYQTNMSIAIEPHSPFFCRKRIDLKTK